jgi:hypothetical protein
MSFSERLRNSQKSISGLTLVHCWGFVRVTSLDIAPAGKDYNQEVGPPGG